MYYCRKNRGVKKLTEKEFKKLKKYQILELMIMQTEKIEQLEKQIEELEQAAKEQEMKIQELGSVAEASLELNSVFVAAQNAADMYLREAKRRAEKIILDAQETAKEQIKGFQIKE